MKFAKKCVNSAIMMLLGVFLLSGSAKATTIERMYLSGGYGASFGNWQANDQIWDTVPDIIWELGVSSAPGGPLLNAADTTISGLPFGNFFLYAEPSYLGLGSHARLDVYLSDSTIRSAIFETAGAMGSGTPWGRTAGDSGITLGWASGVADLVGASTGHVGPNGNNDFYLAVGVVPEPETCAMMLAGLGLLGVMARRRKTKLQ